MNAVGDRLFCCCWWFLILIRGGVLMEQAVIGCVFLIILLICLCTNIDFFRCSWMTGVRRSDDSSSSRSAFKWFANHKNTHLKALHEFCIFQNNLATYTIYIVYGNPMSSYLMSFTELHSTPARLMQVHLIATIMRQDWRAVIFKDKCLARNHMESVDEKSNQR